MADQRDGLLDKAISAFREGWWPSTWRASSMGPVTLSLQVK